MSLRDLGTRIHPRTAVVVHDLVVTLLAWWLANTLRYAMLPYGQHLDLLSWQTLIVLVVQAAMFYWTGLYKGLWRFASVPDLWNILRAVVAGAVVIYIALFLYNRMYGISRSVLLIYPVLLAILLGVPRLAYRYWKDSQLDLFHDANAPGIEAAVAEGMVGGVLGASDAKRLQELAIARSRLGIPLGHYQRKWETPYRWLFGELVNAMADADREFRAALGRNAA